MTYQRRLGLERGRGLMRRWLAERWDGRHAEAGTTIWVEHLLPALYQEFDTLSLVELTYMPNQISD